MTIFSAFIKKYVYRIVICVCIFVPIDAQADILMFDSILYKKENNGDKYNNASWTSLKFEILYPVVGTKKYLNRNLISFTLDSDRVINRTRTDIRIGDDWLRKRKFKSTRNKWNTFWIGSGSLNGTQVSDLRTFDDDEKVVLAWIIANTDELINYALAVNKNMPKRSRLTWERMARGQIFEKNVRRFLGPSARAALKEYDDFNHSKLILKRTIQPNLKLLNYYKGAIDGIGGPQTSNAIKAFEKANGLLVDGVLFGKERSLLVTLASDKYTPKNIELGSLNSVKEIVEKQNKNKLELITTIKQQKNIIKILKVKISSLVQERNALERNQLLSDKLENNLEVQKITIIAMKERTSKLIIERNKLQKLLEKENNNNSNAKFQKEISDLKNELFSRSIQIKALKKTESQLVFFRDKYNFINRINRKITNDLEKQKEDTATLGSNLNLALARVASEQRKKASIENALNLAQDVISKQELDVAELDKSLDQVSNLKKQLIVEKNRSEKFEFDLVRLNNASDENNNLKLNLAEANIKIISLKAQLESSKIEYAELEKQKFLTKSRQAKGFVLSSEWDDLKQWITPQQMRFCTILSDYDNEKVAAQESGNQLKQNLAIDNRDADIDALLLGRNSEEKGYFRNWIGTVEQVFAIYQENAEGVEELAAGVVIKTPCNSVTVGSGRVKSADDERYEGTAFPSDPIYSQLSQVSKGDPILFEGSLLTYQDTGEASRSSKPRFFTNVDSSVNDVEAEKAKKKNKINAPDYFVKIDYLSKL